MNYFELYPGDYLRDTGELSLNQHGAYLLLMASYYSTEDGLPSDRVGLFRIARAMSKDEQAATLFVAERFFTKAADGRLRSERIDEDIQKAKARIEAARLNGSKGGRPPKPKEKPDETQEKPNGFSSGSDPLKPNVTQKKAHQTPDPNNSVGSTEASAQGTTAKPTEAGRACLLMRRAGCVQTNPSHVDLLAAIAEGVTPEALGDTAAEAIASGKNNPFAWAITTARSRHAEGPKPVIASTGPPGNSYAVGKQVQGLQILEGMKNGGELDYRRNREGISDIVVPQLGTDAGR